MNVSPGNTSDHSPDQESWKAKVSTYLGGGSAVARHLSDGADRILCNPGFDVIRPAYMGTSVPLVGGAAPETFWVSVGPVGIASGVPFAALLNPVGDVVCVSPKPEVSGVNARRIVASMEDVHPVRDGGSEKGPSYSVRFRHPHVFAGKNAVSIFIDCCRPDPAVGSGGDLCQETLDSTFHIVNCNPGGI